jgi:rhodanese-related sulfurtransferase
MEMNMADTYAGEITPAAAWQALLDDPKAKLVDVRSQAEWAFVGVPDLTQAGKQPILVQWQIFPTMARNEAFAEQLKSQGVAPDDKLLFLCRSGVRSKAAAELMTQQGFTACWNVTDGFEGPLDDAKHRGGKAGWKAQGLPWMQG